MTYDYDIGGLDALYHSDHLGSTSWKKERFGKPFASERADEARSGILNNTNNTVQHLQYLPYGAPFVDQRTTRYHERFRFTGKERDEETGYGYFGARYMDHEQMAMWLSVDPMAYRMFQRVGSPWVLRFSLEVLLESLIHGFGNSKT